MYKEYFSSVQFVLTQQHSILVSMLKETKVATEILLIRKKT